VGYLPIGFENMTDCVSKVKKNGMIGGRGSKEIASLPREQKVWCLTPSHWHQKNIHETENV
jgi:hypothetical protein